MLLLIALCLAAEPVKKRPTDEERGRELYERHCEACHGAYNRGKGPAAEALVHPVPDLQGTMTVDDALIQLVLRGRGAMPGYEQTFDRFDGKRVLDWMAALRDPDPSAPAPATEPAPSDEPVEDEQDGAQPE